MTLNEAAVYPNHAGQREEACWNGWAGTGMRAVREGFRNLQRNEPPCARLTPGTTLLPFTPSWREATSLYLPLLEKKHSTVINVS